MSEAYFDLSYIRRWACEKLETTNDVATLCGMLTDLARHVCELEDENAKLRELAVEQRRLADAIHAYWADGMNPEQFDALLRVTSRVNRLSDELGIEV